MSDLKVKIGGDASNFRSELLNVTQNADQAGKKIQASFGGSLGKITNLFTIFKSGGIAAFTGVLGAATLVYKAFRTTISDLSEMAKTAKSLEISVGTFQKWNRTAKELDINFENLSKSFSAIGKFMRGTDLDKQREALASIGLELKDIEGLDPSKAFEKITKNISLIDDKLARRKAINLFLDDSAETENIVNSIEKIIEKLNKTPSLIDDEDVKKADRIAKAFSGLGDAIKNGVYDVVIKSGLLSALERLLTKTAQSDDTPGGFVSHGRPEGYFDKMADGFNILRGKNKEEVPAWITARFDRQMSSLQRYKDDLEVQIKAFDEAINSEGFENASKASRHEILSGKKMAEDTLNELIPLAFKQITDEVIADLKAINAANLGDEFAEVLETLAFPLIKTMQYAGHINEPYDAWENLGLDRKTRMALNQGRDLSKEQELERNVFDSEFLPGNRESQKRVEEINEARIKQEEEEKQKEARRVNEAIAQAERDKQFGEDISFYTKEADKLNKILKERTRLSEYEIRLQELLNERADRITNEAKELVDAKIKKLYLEKMATDERIKNPMISDEDLNDLIEKESKLYSLREKQLKLEKRTDYYKELFAKEKEVTLQELLNKQEEIKNKISREGNARKLKDLEAILKKEKQILDIKKRELFEKIGRFGKTEETKKEGAVLDKKLSQNAAMASLLKNDKNAKTLKELQEVTKEKIKQFYIDQDMYALEQRFGPLTDFQNKSYREKLSKLYDLKNTEIGAPTSGGTFSIPERKAVDLQKMGAILGGFSNIPKSERHLVDIKKLTEKQVELLNKISEKDVSIGAV
jgi:hypothetical protein